MGFLPGRRFFGSSTARPPRRVVTIIVVRGAVLAEIQSYNALHPATAPETWSN
jgi:hypothetical protein